jgi:hypothetical protein
MQSIYLDARGAARRHQFRKDARAIDFENVGPLINLTYAEYEQYKAWRFWPSDVSREEVIRRTIERSKEKKKKKRAEKRLERQPRTACDWRDDVLLRMLTKLGGEASLPELIRRARTPAAFGHVSAPRNMPAIRKENANKLRERVRRTIARLVKHEAVEIETRRGVRGPVIFVHLCT